jgi:hypothetical protein
MINMQDHLAELLGRFEIAVRLGRLAQREDRVGDLVAMLSWFPKPSRISPHFQTPVRRAFACPRFRALSGLQT